MTLQRKVIRREVVALLTGSTYCGERVHDGRPARVDARSLPCLLVYTLGEDRFSQDVQSPIVYGRELVLAIELVAEPITEEGLVANVRADDLVDDVMDQVELVLHRNRLLPRVAEYVTILDDERTGPLSLEVERSAEGEQLLGLARLRWGYPYRYDPVQDSTDAQASALRTLGVAYDFPPPRPEQLIEVNP